MLKLKRSSVVVVVLAGLLGVSSVAMAEHEESHQEDTLFSFGYDELNHFLAINIGPNDVYECSLANGALTTEYGDVVDGVYGVVLEAPYEICEVSGVVVAGPNGQINHGQFMKAAKSLYDFKGHGCIVRHLAQSDIGRTEATKLATPDVDPLFTAGDGGDITFATFEADCSRGNKADGLEAESAEAGRPDSPGKSADAPGKNK